MYGYSCTIYIILYYTKLWPRRWSLGILVLQMLQGFWPSLEAQSFLAVAETTAELWRFANLPGTAPGLTLPTALATGALSSDTRAPWT